MRQTAIALACALGLALTGSSASADVITLTPDAAEYVGAIRDGYRMSEVYEDWYINQLIRLNTTNPTQIRTPSAEPYNCPQHDQGSCTETYFRDPTLPSSGLPAARLAGAARVAGTTAVTMTGFTYIIAKYGSGSGVAHVWYVPGLTENHAVFIPQRLAVPNQTTTFALHHYTMFAAPDGGMTLMLLGGALLGIETLRRRLSA
jgi:hypothetical protein